MSSFCPEPLVVSWLSCKSSAEAAEPPGQAGWRKASPLGLPQGFSGFCTTLSESHPGSCAPWLQRRRRSTPKPGVGGRCGCRATRDEWRVSRTSRIWGLTVRSSLFGSHTTTGIGFPDGAVLDVVPRPRYFCDPPRTLSMAACILSWKAVGWRLYCLA